MRKCPACKRWSLEFDPFTKRARCVYLADCGYSEFAADRDAFTKRRFNNVNKSFRSPESNHTAPQHF